MTRGRPRRCSIGSTLDDYKHHLRNLAAHDEMLVGDESVPSGTALDKKTVALAQVSATIAIGAASGSIQHAVALALAADATSDEIVATLEAVTPVIGAARVVSAAPEVAFALGYDIEAALESLDP